MQATVWVFWVLRVIVAACRVAVWATVILVLLPPEVPPSIIKVFGDNARRYMLRHWPSWDKFGSRMAQELTYTIEQNETPR